MELCCLGIECSQGTVDQLGNTIFSMQQELALRIYSVPR